MLQTLLERGPFACACGRSHATGLKRVVLGRGALAALPGLLLDLGIQRPFVICDPNTHRAAGAAALAALPQAIGCVLSQGRPEPDALPMGELALEMPSDCDGIVTVGSGVVGDLGKMLSRLSGKALVAVATAPSMDGFASTSASMLVREVKTSLSAPCPVAILADTEILRQAPLRMLWAGLGDMLAKPGALLEWRMAQLIVDEPYCPEVAALMRRSLRTILAAADGLAERRSEAVEAVTEGLILSGVAMSYAGISRPASGTEHYLSHMWDMQALERHELPDLHGIQVGVATRLALALFDWTREQAPDPKRALSARDRALQTYTADVRTWFGSAASQILALEARERKNDCQRHARRLERILAHWPELLSMMEEELAPIRDCAELMRRLGMPMTPSDLGLTPENVRNALLGAREIRDKYLWVSLLWDLGLLREATGHVVGP